MKYTESSHDRKSAVNTGLYVIIGLCLLIIGGASWFALTRGDDNDTTPSVSSSNPSAYSTPSTSYNESVLEPPSTTSTPIADTVSDQP